MKIVRSTIEVNVSYGKSQLLKSAQPFILNINHHLLLLTLLLLVVWLLFLFMVRYLSAINA